MRRTPLLLGILVLVCASNAQAVWQRQFSQQGFDNFAAVQAFDRQIVYAVGVGTSIPNSLGNVIYGTDDGGLIWSIRGPNRRGLFVSDVDFPTVMTGFACSYDTEPGFQGGIHRTRDAGRTWQALDLRTLTQLRALQAIDFWDANIGWAAGDEGLLLRTVDGGDSWFAQTPPRTDITINDLEFLSDRVGWLVGGSSDTSTSQNRGTIARTENAGVSWTLVEDSLPGEILAIDFTDELHGVAVGRSENGALIYSTEDGGDTWTQRNVPNSPTNGPIPNLNDVHMVDRYRGWAVGGSSEIFASFAAILFTRDGGRTWEVDASYQGALELSGVSFAPDSPDRGWTVGQFLTILRFDRRLVGIDDAPPEVLGILPDNDGKEPLGDDSIEVFLVDERSGVDEASIVMKVNRAVVTPVIEPVPDGYRLVYQPPTEFPPGTVSIEVEACDLATTPNCFQSPVYSYTIGFNNDTVPPTLVEVTPADGAVGDLAQTPLVFRIRDDESGVNQDSIGITVNGMSFRTGAARLSFAADAGDVIATLDPPTGGWSDRDVSWSLTGCDNATMPNCMVPVLGDFTAGAPLPAPRVSLAGYWSSDLDGVSGGTLRMAALVLTPVDRCEVAIGGTGIGVFLRDSGPNDWTVNGDGFYTFEVPLGASAAQTALLEIVPEDGLAWPYLIVE